MTRAYRKRGPEFLEPYKTGKAKPPRGGKIRQKMSAQRAAGMIRANEVLRLCLAGKTPEEIREATGYASRGAVMDAYYRALDENYYLPNAKMRLKEIARLERLHAELWPLVIEEPVEEGEERPVRLGVQAKLEVVDRILKIGAQRQKVAGLEQAPEINKADKADLQQYREMAERILAQAIAAGNTEVTLDYILTRIALRRPEVQGLPECSPT